MIDAVHFVNMITDKGYARVPNGSGTMQYQDHTYEANNQPATGNSDISYESKFRVYPNPANTRVYLLGDTQIINVFNMMGQKVYSDNEVTSIDISNWEDGIYFVKSADSVVKIIKQ